MITKIVEMHPTKNTETSAARSFITERLRSFRFAWEGIKIFFNTEKNAQVHLAAAVAVIVFSVVLHINRYEVIAIVISIAMVWITEMLNTAVEKSMDLVSPDFHPLVKTIKDVAAGAVLVSTIAAVVTGGFIFLPKIIGS